jgi:hypothetical protein
VEKHRGAASQLSETRRHPPLGNNAIQKAESSTIGFATANGVGVSHVAMIHRQAQADNVTRFVGCGQLVGRFHRDPLTAVCNRTVIEHTRRPPDRLSVMSHFSIL